MPPRKSDLTSLIIENIYMSVYDFVLGAENVCTEKFYFFFFLYHPNRFRDPFRPLYIISSIELARRRL
jgi:hypothetical protein